MAKSFQIKKNQTKALIEIRHKNTYMFKKHLYMINGTKINKIHSMLHKDIQLSY